MRGQGYDNGSNMKGKNIGLQRLILNLNPRAFYVPCAAHSLNLVVNDAAKCSLEITNFFGVVQETYRFLSASTNRWEILMAQLPSYLTLKPLSDTRWESRVEAVKALRFNLGKVFDAFFEIFSDTSEDSDTRNEAHSLILKIKSFKFVCSLVLWFEVLTKVNIVSKFLQYSTIDLPAAMELLEELEVYLTEKRSDDGFKELLIQSADLADEIDCDPTFPEVPVVRIRRKKRMFDYEARDEPITSPTDNFRINVFYC